MPRRKRDNRPKILIIGPTPPPYYGVAVSTQLILASPQLRKFRRLHLDTSDRRGIENIGTFDWQNIMLALWHFTKFIQIMTRHRPRLVYLPISQGIGGYLRDLAFLLPGRWLGVPTVVHLRGSEFRTFYNNSPLLMKGLIRYSLRMVRRMIVLGEGLRPIFKGLVPAARVVVVPNGTPDLASVVPLVEKRHSTIRGLFLSNLYPRKGVFVTLQAAIESLYRFPNLEFVFAGEWQSKELQEQILDRVRNLEVADRIHFAGVVVGEEKHRLLMNSDFFVFPPIEPEGQPRVILEAMAAGLPVISTPFGAIPDMVVEGVTGYMVPPNDVKALVDRIGLLVSDSETRMRMSQAIRSHYLSSFTMEQSNLRLVQVFDAVLSEQ